MAIRGLKATVEGKPSTVKVSFKSRKTNKTSKFTYSTKVTVIEDKLAVTGVVATNGTTLTVTGTKLGDLTATDVSVQGNLVASYTAAADGKTATIALGVALVPGSTTNVTINGTTYAVKYEALTASAVELTTTTFDNDTPNQQMKLKVNGAEMSCAELFANGYTTKFYAYTNMNTISASKTVYFFDSTETSGGYTYSTNGVVSKGALNLGVYYIKAVVVKAGVTLESAVTEVTVLDLDTLTTGVNKAVFKDNTSAKAFCAESTGSLKLVQNETATLDKLNITNSGKNYDIDTAGLTADKLTLKSSDSTVLSVTGTTTIKANKAGNATLSVTYGKQSITIAVTIDKNGRKIADIVADAGNATSIVKGEKKILTYYVMDDHGAVMTSSAAIGIYAVSSKENVITISGGAAALAKTATAAAITAENGKVKFTVDAVAPGESGLQFFPANSTITGKAEGSNSLENATIRVVDDYNTTFSLVADPLNAEEYLQDAKLSTIDTNNLHARSKHLVLKLVKSLNGVQSVNTVTFGAISAGAVTKIYYTGDSISISAQEKKKTDNTGFDTGDTIASVANGAVLSDDDLTYLDITAVKAGTSVITIKSDDKVITEYTVTVENTTPVVGSINLKKATYGDSDAPMKLQDILDMTPISDTYHIWELNSKVNYAANATTLKVRYTEDGFTTTDGSVTIAAKHFYIYNVGAKDTKAVYQDLGVLTAVVAEGTGQVNALTSTTGTIIDTSTATLKIVPTDVGTINLFLDNDGTVDGASTCVATITVQ